MNEESLFYLALEKSADERTRFLKQVCVGDDELRHRVEVLLQAHEHPDNFLARPAVDLAGKTDIIEVLSPNTNAPALRLGLDLLNSRVGAYRLREQLGEGGMGIVFLAEQERPIRRQVALKVIRPGIASGDVIARFEAERQALALMDHSNLAHVLDAGTTDSGRPYFVMELIRGAPITQFCDEQRLTLRQRLELFVPVCQAVQHAHHKGIIHRDLKPSNVLVTLCDGKPVPKVIDFGVAKAIGAKLTERTLLTEVGAVVGTLEYMSPEQAELNSLDVDTRSDVYTLGVLLYELLTGTTPLERERTRGPLLEALRLIREEEPPRPSTRLSATAALPGVAGKRGLEPGKLSGLVRGELDWIVMKCLEKDRDRRYDSANSLALDIERYLRDEPVLACPPSAGYRLSKFVRRNRGAVLAAAIVLLTLIGGVIGTTWAMIRATDAETAARLEAVAKETARAQAVAERDRALAAQTRALAAEADTRAFSEYLVNHVLAASRPEGMQHGLGIAVTLAQALEAAEGEMARVFKGRPKAEATARQAHGVTWRNLGEYDRAEKHLRRAVSLRERELGPDDVETLDSRNSLGLTLAQAGRIAEAIPILEQVLERYEAILGPNAELTLTTAHNLAWSYQRARQFDKALPLYEQTVARWESVGKCDHPRALTALNDLASAYQDRGRLDKALPLHRRALERRTATRGADHPETLQSVSDLASAFQAANQIDRALPLFEEAFAKYAGKFGPDHPTTLIVLNNLAIAYQIAGQIDKAVPLFEQVLERRKIKPGPDHLDTLCSVTNLGKAYRAASRLDRAFVLLGSSVEKHRALLDRDHPQTLAALVALADAYREAGQRAKAILLFEEALRGRKVKLDPDHPDTLRTMNNLAGVYKEDGQRDRARVLLQEVLPKLRVRLGPNHPDTLQTMTNLGAIYRDAGEIDRALPLLEAAVAGRKAQAGLSHRDTLSAMNSLALGYQAARQFDKALPLFEETLQGRKAALGAGHAHTLGTQRSLALTYQDAGQWAKAEPLLRELLDHRRRHDGPEAAATVKALLLLGNNLARQRKDIEAESVMRAYLTIQEKKQPVAWGTFEAKSVLGVCLANQQKYAEAEPLLLEGYKGLKERASAIPARIRMAYLTSAANRLVQLYQVWGNQERADQWREELGRLKGAGTN